MYICRILIKTNYMKSNFLAVLTITSLMFSCSVKEKEQSLVEQETDTIEIYSEINENGQTIKDRFNTPIGYERESYGSDSWESFLQNLPLKENGSVVHTFDGQVKYNYSVYSAVVDLPIGNKDLQQCADAVMRLRADYLFSQKKYNDIEFLFVSGKKSNYSSWLGGRIPNDNNFWAYLENVFSFASTLSLDKQLKTKDTKSVNIGDVFIKGGAPGHAVIVVDKCVSKNGKEMFMIAQSYMPAQEIQVLVNPKNPNSVWYDSNFGEILDTPEWSFTSNQLKRF